MRSGASNEHIGRAIESAIWLKEEGHQINKPGFIKPVEVDVSDRRLTVIRAIRPPHPALRATFPALRGSD